MTSLRIQNTQKCEVKIFVVTWLWLFCRTGSKTKIQTVEMVQKQKTNLCSEKTPGGLSSFPSSTLISGRCTSRHKLLSGQWRRWVLMFLVFLVVKLLWSVTECLYFSSEYLNNNQCLPHQSRHIQLILCLSGWSIQRPGTLGQTERWRERLHFPRPCLFCC